ncbi:MAG: SBBP repeat-containing protein, partial [Armatimonadetes bacterium]|nr:SBBP repeat-containing protein [Armatimonadota bacterium]
MKTRIILLFTSLLMVNIVLLAQTPEWQWAIQAGGTAGDRGYGIILDDSQNSYVTGFFDETATFGPYSLTSSGSNDIFVAKMDEDGDWQWATKAGGTGNDIGYAITIDDNGNCYVTGCFYGTATFGTYSLTNSGNEDIFVAKMDAIGTWQWVTQAGGIDLDNGVGIEIDNAGNSYVTGSFHDTATFGSYSLTSSGLENIFVAKMDAVGNWSWAIQAGGIIGNDEGIGIAVDDTGNSYVTGYFIDTATFGSYSLTSSGCSDIFVAKTDAVGNWLWATQAGGPPYDWGSEITIDNTGNSYVTGYFGETAIFGSYSLTSSGSGDIFVAKMDEDGNWLWATQAGGSSYEFVNGMTIDDGGNSFVTGRFEGTASFGPYSLSSNGFWDIFVAKMDTNGNWLWTVQAGGNGYDWGYGIAIDDDGNSFVTGEFEDSASFGSYSLSSSGQKDIFVAKLGNDTSVENEIIPTKMELSNYPNPFNPSTTISFSIPVESKVNISIFNIKGQKVKTVANDQFEKGIYSILW